jgi:hypothetical protein
MVRPPTALSKAKTGVDWMTPMLRPMAPSFILWVYIGETWRPFS